MAGGISNTIVTINGVHYSREFLQNLYRQMLRIRVCEESFVQPILDREILCPVHLCTGQEELPSESAPPSVGRITSSAPIGPTDITLRKVAAFKNWWQRCIAGAQVALEGVVGRCT